MQPTKFQTPIIVSIRQLTLTDPRLQFLQRNHEAIDTENDIREALMDWADNDLVEEYYGVESTMSGRIHWETISSRSWRHVGSG